MSHSFSKDELRRYSRQLMLADVGITGQEKLRNAKVLVIGAGGLGCPVLLYLAGAGVGTIGIIDFDTIEIHNLHRQILYDTDDVGKGKAFVAADKIRKKNPFIALTAYQEQFTAENCVEIISDYDIVVDGSDNFQTRYLVNDTCVALNKPLIYGSILLNNGQLAVFNLQGSKNLRDLYPEAPNPEDVPNCDQNGVMGFVPGIIGTYMCNLVIQVILGKDDFRNKLFLFDFEGNGLVEVRI